MAYFLRFTSSPTRDLENGHSLWYLGRPSEVDRVREEGVKELVYDEDVGMWAIKHLGLSGHELKAKTLDEAIREVREEGPWFGNPTKQSWAIFEGENARPAVYNPHTSKYVETPEGDDFTPHEVLYFETSNRKYDPST